MPNYDEKTGIHYGVISPNSISSYALEDIYEKGTDTICENGKQELLDDLKEFCEDHNLNFDRINTDSFEDQYYEHYESDGSGIMDYEDQEYTLHVSGDNFGIFVIKSPYYTFTKQCSPCAPGAGDLDHPVDIEGYNKTPHDTFMYGTVKAYCLGSKWFDKDNDQYSRKIPYRVYRVDNDQEVV